MKQRRTRVRSRDNSIPSQPWLITFADLTNLLLAFFVLLFAMSTIDARKFEKTIVSLQGSFGFLPGKAIFEIPETLGEGVDYDAQTSYGIGLSEAELQALLNLRQMHDWRQLEDAKKQLMDFIAEEGLEASVLVAADSRGIVIRFADSVLFDIGKADLKPESRYIVDRIGIILRKLPNQIRVEGHTDNLPISTERFPSNWELSTARATTVVRYLVESNQMEASLLSAAGYGEYRPLVPNDTDSNRALNRRVDVVILTMGLSVQEPTLKGDADE